MAPWKLWTRGRRPPSAPARGAAAAPALAIALATTLVAAGCTSAGSSAGAAAAPGGAASPAITAAAARAVFDRYVAAAGTAAPKAASALVTGVEQAVLGASLVEPGAGRYTYSSPTFYLPEAAGYPRFFVVSATRTLQGASGGNGVAATGTGAGGARLPPDGPALLLFSQAGGGAPWLLASVSRLPPGVTVPPLARDGSGYIPIATPTAGTFLAQPDDVGALQAGVVDEGPANAAARAVADGPLTTGLYQGAVDHVTGMTAPRGDVYQWELQGVNDPEFALRTANGGALVFYAMTLDTTVAVPGVINKANPILPGPAIPVPLNVRVLLPKDQPPPHEQLQSQQTLSFAAVDPPTGTGPQNTGKIQVIAVGGGLTSASAS